MAGQSVLARRIKALPCGTSPLLTTHKTTPHKHTFTYIRPITRTEYIYSAPSLRTKDCSTLHCFPFTRKNHKHTLAYQLKLSIYLSYFACYIWLYNHTLILSANSLDRSLWVSEQCVEFSLLFQDGRNQPRGDQKRERRSGIHIYVISTLSLNSFLITTH